MLPTTTPQSNGDLGSRDAARHTAGAKRYKYLRRLLHFKQMDFEFALWQMFYLFTSPQRVYRNFHYRKQTKDQWARDDPAFLVLLSIWLCGKSVLMRQSLVWLVQRLALLTCSLYLLSVNDRLWSGAGHGSPGDSEVTAVGRFHRLYRSWPTHINTYVVSFLLVMFQDAKQSIHLFVKA